MKNNLYFLLILSLFVSLLVSCQSDGNQETTNGTETTNTTDTTPTANAEKTPEQLIMGRWQNVDNKEHYVIFAKDNQMITKIGEEIINVKYVYNSPCLSKFQGVSVDDVSTFDCFMETSRQGGVIQRVWQLDETTLVYALTDGSNEKTTFKKIQ